MIVLQYKKYSETIASKYIEVSFSQKLPLLKNNNASNNWLK